MSETTPTESSAKPAASSSTPRLQAVPKDAPKPQTAPAAPSTGGGYMTGLFALLLAVAVFALVAVYSSNQSLAIQVEGLQGELAAAQAELDASRGQLAEARDIVGDVRGQLDALDAVLAPPALATEGAAGADVAVDAGAEAVAE